MILTILRAIFNFIDLALNYLFYWLARLAVQAYFEMAKITSGIVAFEGPLKYIIQRVTVLAGIYALFKLAITLINYAINPEKTDEGSKNGIKIVQNIFVAIVLLSISSTAFGYLGKVSEAIFDRGDGVSVINRIIFGESRSGSNNADGSTEPKRIVQHIRGLFINDNGQCDNISTRPNWCIYYERMLDGEYDPNIINDTGISVAEGVTYIPILSWIAAIFIIILFGKYCFDLGKRLLKLIVLQIISPVPIIMYVDPKQKNRLTLFAKTYLSIWLQVFIRILTIYIAYVAIELVASGTILNNVSGEVKWIVQFLLYIGILFGASDIPKLIDDIIGTKLAGETKGMGFGAILGGIIGGTAGAFGGAIAGGFAGSAAGGGAKVATGILSGAASGMWNGTKAGNAKNAIAGIGQISSAIKGSYGTAGKVATAGVGGYMVGKFDNYTDRNARVDKNVTDAKAKVDAYDKFKAALLDDYSKSKDAAGNPIGTLENDARYSTATSRLNAYRKQIENSQMSDYSSSRAEELKQKLLDAQNDLSNREAVFLNRMDDEAVVGFENYNGDAKAAYDAFYESDDYKELNSRVQMAKQEYNSYEATKPQTMDQNIINKYQAEIDAAKKEYEKRAFDWFATTKVKSDPKTIDAKYKDKSLYSTLSESEKAYYELSRANKGAVLGTKDMKDQYDNELKAAKKALKEAEAEQQTTRYKNAGNNK